MNLVFTESAFRMSRNCLKLTGLDGPFLNKKFEQQDWNLRYLITAVEIAFEQPAGTGFKKRLVQFAKTTFYNANLSGELPEGEIAQHGLPFKAWEAAYTDAQLTAWFDTKLPNDLLNPLTANEEAMKFAGFEKEDGYYWRPSGQVIFDAAQFYLPTKQKDIFGQLTELEYDTYRLLPKRSFTEINTVLLETTAEFDYRTLQPKLLTDPNGNRSAAVFDALGMVTHTSAMGKDGENIGDADLLDPHSFLIPWHFPTARSFAIPPLPYHIAFCLALAPFFITTCTTGV